MNFNIDHDEGPEIAGWLAPDNPSVQPVVVVVVDGTSRFVVPADTLRAGVKASGLHETGHCGFVLQEGNCPGLAAARQVEIYDEDSNLLVYRRAATAALPTKLFHLETSAQPGYPVFRNLARHFQMTYGSVEFIGEEAVASVLNLGFSPSILVSGAINYVRHLPSLRAKEFQRVVLFGDPFRGLAAVLSRLKKLGQEAGADQGWRRMGQGAIVSRLADVDLTDPSQIAKALKALSDAEFFSLADPVVRKLVANDPAERVQPHHLGLALTQLAEFDVVGFEDDLDTFVWSLEGLLGAGELPREAAPDPPGFPETVAALTACRPARELVRLDGALLELARQAIAKAERPAPAA